MTALELAKLLCSRLVLYPGAKTWADVERQWMQREAGDRRQLLKDARALIKLHETRSAGR